MSIADAYTFVGFCVFVVGVGMVASIGWSCVVGGLLLFLAGGLATRREAR